MPATGVEEKADDDDAYVHENAHDDGDARHSPARRSGRIHVLSFVSRTNAGGAVVRHAIKHLDLVLGGMTKQGPFLHRLAYATDTHSCEDWLRTEIAYELSRDFYAGRKGPGFWCFPEKEGLTDLPIMQGRDRKTPRCIVELKCLFNKRGLGASNKECVQSDVEKLRRGRCSSRVFVAALIFQQYNDPEIAWASLNRLRDVDHMTAELFGAHWASDRHLRWFDANLPPGYAKEYEHRRIYNVRFCRLNVSVESRRS